MHVLTSYNSAVDIRSEMWSEFTTFSVTLDDISEDELKLPLLSCQYILSIYIYIYLDYFIIFTLNCNVVYVLSSTGEKCTF